MTAETTTRRPAGRRAARVEETRRRIVDATLELHTTVGPAGTTISAIAERARVQRHTVYAHFPDETALFTACSGLWQQRNPFPDATAWSAVADPRERLATALGELYAYYDRSGAELALVLADAERVEFIAGEAAAMERDLDEIAELLLRGRAARGRRRARVRAAVRHALALSTWQGLVAHGGLTAGEAVALMIGLADVAEGATPAPPPARAPRRPTGGGSAAGEAAPTSSTGRGAPSGTARGTRG